MKGCSSAGHALKSSPGHLRATSGGLFGTGVGRTPGELTAPTNPLDSSTQTGRGRVGLGTSQRVETPRSVTCPDSTQADPAFCQRFGKVSEAPREETPKKGEKDGKETGDEKGRGARPEAARPQSGTPTARRPGS